MIFRGLFNVSAVMHVNFLDLDYVEDTICDTKQGATDDKGVSDA